MVINAARLVALRAQNIKPTKVADVVSKFDVDPATSHIRRDGHRSPVARVLDDLCLSLVLSAVGIGVLSTVTTSPAEVAQAEEIDALRGQLASAHSQLTSFSDELEDLAETDREIYRTVLNAEPISEDEFQLGVGGAEDSRFARFSTPTAELLTETAETFDRLERQLQLQSRSYQEIRTLASQRDAVLRQQPAIPWSLPTCSLPQPNPL